VRARRRERGKEVRERKEKKRKEKKRKGERTEGHFGKERVLNK